MAKVRTTFVVGAALVTVAAAMLSQHALYEWIVVPKLESVRQVPIAWWLGVVAPIVLASLVAGWKARSCQETLTIAALGAVGLRVYEKWLAENGRPGWYKSFAVEAPLQFWTLGLLQVFVFLVVLASIGHAWRRKRAAS